MKHPLYLVAVDGSEWSERAVTSAVKLAKKTGAKVYLYSVIPWSGFRPLSLAEIDQRPIVRKDEESALVNDVFKPMLTKHADSGVEIETGHTWGHPLDTVRKEIKEKRANMVFVGRRGRSQLLDLMMGSVASGLSHSVGIPIVLVP